MGAYRYIENTLKEQYSAGNATYKAKVRSWLDEPPVSRVARPSNLPRARRLGYRAKKGYAVVRVRIRKGRRTRPKPMGGRKPKSNYRFVQPGQSHQAIAEQRAARVYRNMEVLNSYWVGEDGNHKFFEVILGEPAMKTVKDTSLKRKGRAFRGLTSAGKKGRPTKRKTPNKRRKKDKREHVGKRRKR